MYNLFVNNGEMVGMIIAAIITFLGTVYIAVRTYNRSSYNVIHESSKWREELMKIASKNNIDIDDIYRMRASVYSTSSGAHPIDLLTIEYFKYIVPVNKACDNRISFEDREIARIICRGLLHINWIYNTRQLKYFKKRDSRKVYKKILFEILEYKSIDNSFTDFVSKKSNN